MSFEEERLAILQRVSKGELSPQEGQLEIAMLKVRHQSSDQEPGLAQAEPAYEARRENPFDQIPFGRNFQPVQLSGPLAIAIIIPFVMIGIVLVVGLGLFLALPTYVLVYFYNQAAAGNADWPMLSYWPTLFSFMGVFTLVTVLNWGRRLRAIFQRQG